MKIYLNKKIYNDNNIERRSKRRRSSSPRGDHYIPNYSRDGYDPAPRFQGNFINLNYIIFIISFIFILFFIHF